MSRNLGRQEDAEKYVSEAVRHVERMTERERYRTRGLFYLVTGDYHACVTEFGDLVSRYHDKAASKFAALAYTHLLCQRTNGAIAAAEKALANSTPSRIVRTFVFAVNLGKTHSSKRPDEKLVPEDWYGRGNPSRVLLRTDESGRHSVRRASQSLQANPVRTRALWLTPERAPTSRWTSDSFFCRLQRLICRSRFRASCFEVCLSA
jgi:hypothetical protein